MELTSDSTGTNLLNSDLAKLSNNSDFIIAISR